MTRATLAEERAAAPRRLATAEDRTGELLRQADRAFRSQISPERAWNRFQARRQRRGLIRFAVLAAATSLAVAFARHRLLPVPVEPPTLVAEHVPAPQPSSVASARAVVLERRVSPPASAVPARSNPTRPSSALAPSPRTPIALLPAEPLSDATCRRWATEARPERAIDCYQSLARDSGIGAEVALYEAARLSAEALADAPRALALLEQHGARFPNSALRVEVEWLKIRSLERAGRLDEALSASEALLDSPVGRALAPKLHLLRGRIYAEARHECALALPEYVALLGEPGPAGDEAEFKRAQCLDQLQKRKEARAAYQCYLDRADARSAEAARARLDALSDAAKASEGQP